jgi:hypothetical protein
MYLRTCGDFKSANRKSAVSHLQEVCNSNKLKSAHLWICDLRNLFVDHPHLKITSRMVSNFHHL